MNLDQIETKCFILALFIRDDGERFLLGSRAYEFVDSQLHFAANSYQNDIVEVQGNDGLMLAGQVRRGTAQVFDGYIGDSSVSRSDVEQYRRDFMAFFRKNHYYKVVYVFPDGSAIQRRQGFIVEAPEVQELYQLFPQYHIAMNFEDINYYNYEEDSDGQEIYGESASLKIATAATGGLIWEEISSTTLSGEGSSFTLNGTVAGNAISNVQLKGDTTQQTYSGKNLLQNYATSTTSAAVTITVNSDGTITANGTATGVANIVPMTQQQSIDFPAGTYTLWADQVPSPNGELRVETYKPSALNTKINNFSGERGSNVLTFTTTETLRFRVSLIFARSGNTLNNFKISELQLESGSAKTSYEPYVGGIPAPNPNYPQTVNTVTGRQVVTISDGGSQSQSYEVNLGKNLFDADSPNIISGKYLASNGTENSDSGWDITDYIPIQPNTAYTMSSVGSDLGNSPSRCYYDANKVFISGVQHGRDNPFTNTSPAGAYYMRETIRHTDTDIQIELGSTATSYASYFTPIELCKLGTYQDYIYKSGNDWYIRKETSTITYDGTENWTYQSQYSRCYVTLPSDIGSTQNDYGTTTKCSHFMPGRTTESTLDNVYMVGSTAISFKSTSIITSKNDWTTWLGTHNVAVYYGLSTPTDTQIANAALIAQLDALAGATTYNSQTIFTVTSANQLAILSLSTIGVDSSGVVWDSIGATWEEGTGGGPTMIDIQSIDNVYPVWTVTGPAINPQISVLTTNTTLSYSGTVTASQELTVDMFNKTATLNGVSVIGNVSGDWVYLKPGINRVTYTTNNADAPDSTIWWQEIVG